jgi:hypothetical protein
MKLWDQKRQSKKGKNKNLNVKQYLKGTKKNKASQKSRQEKVPWTTEEYVKKNQSLCCSHSRREVLMACHHYQP